MSSRALIVAGTILLALGALSLLLPALSSLRGPGPASLVVQASNAGVALTPEDARVYVHAAGEPAQLLAEGAPGEPFALSPGRYDARVVHTSAADRSSVWLRDIALEPGGRMVSTAHFSAGEIDVEAAVGSAEPGRVVIFVFRPDEHDAVVTSMASGVPVTLAAGSYDLRVVWSVRSEEKAVRWLQGVQVRAGLQTRLEVAFDRGSLLLEARNAGEPMPPGTVELTVLRAGDPQRESLDAGLAGVPLGLPAGRYDVEAVYTGSSDRPARWLRGIEVRDGELSAQVVEFSSGAVIVRAELENGEALGPYDAYVYYYRAGDHEQSVAYTPSGSQAILDAGRYDVRATFFRSNDQPDIWLRDLEVVPGRTLELRAAFRCGRLIVRAFDGSGEELIGDNVFVDVYAAGERTKAVATARSGEQLTLTEGVYDVRARDTRSGSEERWLDGVRLRSGAVTEQIVTF